VASLLPCTFTCAQHLSCIGVEYCDLAAQTAYSPSCSLFDMKGYLLHPLSSRVSRRSVGSQLQQGQVTDRHFALACRNAIQVSHDPWTLSLCQRTGAAAMSSVLALSFLLELGVYAIAAAGIRLFRNRSSRARQQEAQEHPETIYQVSASRASSEAVCIPSA